MQKGIFAFADNDKIHIREMDQKMFPQKSGANAAENNFYVLINLFGNPCNINSSPSVGMQDGKTDNI